MNAQLPDPFNPGSIIDGRYQLDELIARGGMATVYRATDSRLNRTVAIKILSSTLAQDTSFIDRFNHEVHASAALTHPNVVAVHDTGVVDGFPYMVMEYVPGRTLREVLRETGPMTPAHVLEIMRSVLAGLAAAHDAGFIHRDVKPENVLITNTGLVKVTDFGIARAMDGQAVSDSTGSIILGTMAYVSPEVVQQDVLDQRADVYSSGILLFELLTGRVPFTAASPLDVAYRHVNEDVPAPSSFAPDVPPAVDHLVLAATRRNRNDRLQTAREFQDGVDRALAAVPAAEALTTALPNQPTLILANKRGTHRATGAVQVTQTRPTNSGASVTGAHRAANPNKKKRSRLYIALALVLALVGWYQTAGNTEQVPELTNLTVEQATKILQPLDLKVETSEDFSETVDNGLVISTQPAAGGKVRRGKAVILIVSKGKERFIIPSSIIDQDPSTAKSLLESLTMTVQDTVEKYDDKVKKGQVSGTIPKIGSSVKRATAVTLVISKGPKPVDVPVLVGVSLTKATSTLTKLGLKIDVTDQIFDKSPTGSIVTTTPAAGQSVPKGTTISVVVSKGPPLVAVPNVVGMSVKKATSILTKAGFKVKTEKQLAIVVLHQVYTQNPGGGGMAPQGSTITLKIV